jgi:Fe-S-cluster containining protein
MGVPVSEFFPCRAGCGACCIAISISSAIPGMPDGKPAGVRCAQLDDDNLCRIFGQPERPKVCSDFQAELQFCGETPAQALRLITELEQLTRSEAAN